MRFGLSMTFGYKSLYCIPVELDVGFQKKPYMLISYSSTQRVTEISNVRAFFSFCTLDFAGGWGSFRAQHISLVL